jgi:hypothetical protein
MDQDFFTQNKYKGKLLVAKLGIHKGDVSNHARETVPHHEYHTTKGLINR